MSDFLIVPRELLERMQKHVSNFEAQDELRALLAAPAVAGDEREAPAPFMWVALVGVTRQQEGSESKCREWADAWNATSPDQPAVVVPLWQTSVQASLVADYWKQQYQSLRQDYEKSLTTRPAQTEQQPVAWQRWAGDYHEVTYKQLTKDEVSRGWSERPLYAAPIAQTEQQPQIMGRVYDGKAELNSIGRELPDHSPLYAAPIAQTPADGLSFVQEVPAHCDRIVWRGRYYHLPLTAPKPEQIGLVEALEEWMLSVPLPDSEYGYRMTNSRDDLIARINAYRAGGAS